MTDICIDGYVDKFEVGCSYSGKRELTLYYEEGHRKEVLIEVTLTMSEEMVREMLQEMEGDDD